MRPKYLDTAIVSANVLFGNIEMRMSDKRTCGDGVVCCRHSDQYKGISRKLLPGQVLDTLYRHSADSETVWRCQESGVRTHFTYFAFDNKMKIILCYIWYKRVNSSNWGRDICNHIYWTRSCVLKFVKY